MIYKTLLSLIFVSLSSAYFPADTFMVKELQNGLVRIQNKNCVKDLQNFLDNLINLNGTNDNFWALQMFDASSKIPDGLLFGSLVHMGQYDECLQVDHPTGQFYGQHCMLDVHLSTSALSEFTHYKIPRFMAKKDGTVVDVEEVALDLFFGICVPSSCSADDLNDFFNQSVAIQQFAKVYADPKNCWTKENREWSSGAWIFIGFLALLLVLSLLSTFYEIFQIFVKSNGHVDQLLSSFSFYCNGKTLFEVKKNEGLSCLHGIRTLSMFWVVLGHTYENIPYLPAINLVEVADIPVSVSHTLINNSFYSVDTFFFLSGLLVAFVFFRNIGKKGYFDVPTSYIHRYLRLTPQFALVIVANITLLEFIGSGPLWTRTTADHIRLCRKSWWSSVIYLQNYLTPIDRCLGQSWYVQCDMQMFWISPLILYTIYLLPKYAFAFLGILIIGSSFWTFGLAFSNKFFASIYLNNINPDDQFAYDYEVMHTRLTPWLVGIALGYIICGLTAQRKQISLPKVVVLLGWVFTTTVCISCLYSMVWFTKATGEVFLQSAFFVAFTRLAWALGISWIVFACVYGYGGIVNTVLSIGIFQPLGKLSYIVYLVHITLIDYRTGIMRSNYNVGDFEIVYEFLGTIVISYVIAIAIFLTVEAPVAAIDRYFLSSLKICPYPNKKKPNVKEAEIEEGTGN